MGSTLFRDPQARSSALAALGTPQPRAFGSLNRVDPLDSASNLYLDLRPGSPGGHRVTKVFLTWSLGHSTKFAVPRSQSTNMDEVVKNMEKSIIVSFQILAKQYRLYSFCSIAISTCSRLCPLTASC